MDTQEILTRLDGLSRQIDTALVAWTGKTQRQDGWTWRNGCAALPFGDLHYAYGQCEDSQKDTWQVPASNGATFVLCCAGCISVERHSKELAIMLRRGDWCGMGQAAFTLKAYEPDSSVVLIHPELPA